MSKKDKEEAKGAAPDDASSAPAPERPQGDWPARPEGSTPVQLAQRRTWRRGMFFGALLLLVLLVLLPLLAYGLALGYVKLGFLKSRIDAELAKNFGAGAGLAALDSEGLEALHLESIRLPDAAGQGQDAVTVESADLRWDLWTLATEQRLRSVSLLKPNLILRRDTQGAWNLKLSGGGGSSYVIEQLEARDGTLDLSWAPGRRVKLEALQATLLQPDAPLPVSATLQGRWPSGQAFNGTFTFGPGFAFSTTLNGALELKRDLGEAFPAPEGLEGALTFDLSAHREAGAGEAPTPVTGRVEARGLKLPLGPDLALKLERRALELRGALAWPKDALVPEPRDLEIRLERVGRFGGTPSYEAGGRPALGLRDGTLNVDLAALRALFDPPLLGPEYSAQGTLKLEEVRARVPLDGAWTAAAFEGRLAAEGVRVSVPEFGALPALGLRAKLDYSEGRLQVSGAEVSVENLLSLAGSVSGRVAPPAEPLLELLKGLRLERVELDLGRFAASTLGQELIERRLPRAWLAGGAPPLEALGKLAGQDLKVTSRAEGERTTLRLEGLAAQGLEVVRWPAELNVPQVRFDGDLAAEARFVGGACRAVAVEGRIRSDGAPAVQGELGFEADLDGEGRLRPRRLALVNLHAPAADVARLAGLKDLYKFKVDGKLEVLDGVLDLSGGGFTGSIRLNGFGVDHAINQVSTLDMNILKVKDVQAVAEVKRAGPRWSVAGRIESADAYVLLLKVVGAAFPMNFAASLEDAGADGARPVRLDLNWQGGFVKLDGVLETSERGALRLKGHAETSMLDRLAFNFDVTVDPENRRVGPLQVTARGVNLAQVIERLPASLRPAGWTLAGQAPELKLSVEPFVLGSVWDLAEGKFPLKGRLSGTLKDGSVRHAGTASEAERIEGAFEATFARESASPSYLFGGFARLDGYEALLFRDVYVPPPEPGQQSVCQWGLRVLRDADGSMDVRVDRAALDLAGLLAFEAHGRVRVPAEGAAPAGGEGLLKAKLNVPDLAKAQAKLGRPNLRFRFPDLAEMRVSGGLSYEGTHVWSAESGALSGRARFRRAAFELGGARALKVRDLDGELPLCFYRGLWPGDWAREQRATLTVSGIALEPARVPQAPLAIVATPNELRVVNAVPVEVPGGRALVSDARAADLLGREPRLEAGVEVERIDLDALAQAEGWRVKGLQNAVLAGNLGRVTLVRRAEPVASWLLAADGELRAPFFLGQLKVGGLYARGLFGNSPVWGLKRVALEGFSLRNLTKSNPQLGRVKTVATVALTDLSAVGLRLEDIVSFTLDIDSVPRDGADDEYDGRFAYVVAPEMVERTAKSKGMTVDGIADMNFGFSKLGMRFVLAGGKLAGPQGKVAGGLIIKGAGLFSPDIAGRPGLAMDWQECVRYLRERAAKLQTLPPPPEGD